MKVNKKNIILELAEQGLTITELGERSGVPTSTLHRVMSKETATPAIIGKIAKGLGISAKELMIQ